MAQLHLVPARGYLIGSSSTRFVHQTACDIHLEDYYAPWVQGQPKRRVCHTCTAWGTGLLFVERKGAVNDPWATMQFGHQSLMVQDFGEAPQGPGLGGLPNLPAAGLGLYFPIGLAAGAILGHTVLWNHQTNVRQTQVGQTLHYHKYRRRIDHGWRRPTIYPPGSKHYEFVTLSFGSQVQNYRRISS